MNQPRTAKLAAVLVLFLVQAVGVFAQVQVGIEIVDNSIKTRPSQLLTDTDYRLQVRVLDKDNNPVSGSSVNLSVIGPGTIIGDKASMTDSSGTASFNVKFDGVGTLQVFVEGKRAGRILVNYSEVPGYVVAYPAVLLVVLVGAVFYLAFRGPLSVLMGKRSK